MEQFAREVMSGGKCGLAASLLRAGLWFAQWPYRCGVAGKNALFDCGLRKPFEVGVPIISVGNLTTGGTGKTPVVAFLANWFQEAGVKVGLLSRGYKSLGPASTTKSSDDPRLLLQTLSPEERGDLKRETANTRANDEKLVLDQLCPGVPHWLNSDRIASAMQATSEGGCKLLILDDAFQHRRLHRDLDIVLVDALNPWGYGHCLPRGLLREPIRAIRRADLVLITRADLASADQLTAIRTELVRQDHVGSVVEVSFRPTALINSLGATCPLSEIAGRRCLGFCGVGNPESFEQTLRRLGVDIVEFQAFPDHYHFGDSDLAQLAKRAEAISADLLIVTQKDLVKLRTAEIGGRPLWAVSIGAEVIRGSQILDHWLWTILERARGGNI